MTAFVRKVFVLSVEQMFVSRIFHVFVRSFFSSQEKLFMVRIMHMRSQRVSSLIAEALRGPVLRKCRHASMLSLRCGMLVQRDDTSSVTRNSSSGRYPNVSVQLETNRQFYIHRFLGTPDGKHFRGKLYQRCLQVATKNAVRKLLSTCKKRFRREINAFFDTGLSETDLGYGDTRQV